MSNTVLIIIVIFILAILLMLNIFLVYIPVNKIKNALEDIDEKVEESAVIIKPIIDKFLPLIETL